MKNEEQKKTPPATPDKKQPLENPEKGSGKQDREQGRTGEVESSNYNDDLGNEEKETTQESVTFEQDIENAKDTDPERNPQKRSPQGEDPDDVAKQGKEFEPGIDEGNKDSI